MVAYALARARLVTLFSLAPSMMCKKGHFTRSISVAADVVQVEILQFEGPNRLFGSLDGLNEEAIRNAILIL
jgi:hypothetical protein